MWTWIRERISRLHQKQEIYWLGKYPITRLCFLRSFKIFLFLFLAKRQRNRSLIPGWGKRSVYTRFWDPVSYVFNRGQFLTPWSKAARCFDHHLPPFTLKVRKIWGYYLLRPYVFAAYERRSSPRVELRAEERRPPCPVINKRNASLKHKVCSFRSSRESLGWPYSTPAVLGPTNPPNQRINPNVCFQMPKRLSSQTRITQPVKI